MIMIIIKLKCAYLFSLSKGCFFFLLKQITCRLH